MALRLALKGATRLGSVFAGSSAIFLTYQYAQGGPFDAKLEPEVPGLEEPPTRSQQVEKLKSTRDFDVLVIGGGATGAYTALDFVLRGFTVALVEKDDFGGNGLSASTRHVDAGLRDLGFTYGRKNVEQWQLYRDSVRERSILLRQAPHLCSVQSVLTPCYTYRQVVGTWLRMKVQDLVDISTHGFIGSSHFVSAAETTNICPTISSNLRNGRKLAGSISRNEVQVDFQRLPLTVALTAALHGAVVLNHAAVPALKRDGSGKISGATILDKETGREVQVNAKAVVLAVEDQTDILTESSNDGKPLELRRSEDASITLAQYYAPREAGIMLQRTEHSPPVIVLPWNGVAVAERVLDPSVSGEDLSRTSTQEAHDVLNTVDSSCAVSIRKQEVKAVMPGTRLMKSSVLKGKETIYSSRTVAVSLDGLVTVIGDKLSNSRLTAKNAVAMTLQTNEELRGAEDDCRTAMVKMLGSHGWDPSYFVFLLHTYENTTVPQVSGRTVEMRQSKMSVPCAKHIASTYGDRGFRVAQLMTQGFGRQLISSTPVTEAEVIHAIRDEMATTVSDVIARRTRLAYFDASSCRNTLTHLVQLMGEQLKWSRQRRDAELQASQKLLDVMDPNRTVFNEHP
mmetsp:Transcript_1789/g.5426  ORF Transcript_1789/g.5426 Transcript_1789/m.5426 type:complete len:625 (+) Transcript_1789:171-2045(+)|eukprot:CAMPEP_0198726324 /NCGR_PEP_ID=MMETSP1475-20131203/3409_1 /TAXON_ID= ORGANISM="Unidentified sp., Strain CCMP1999" /NCGR_SAMPLE_ID=MMETSP1475 /ASSEMBLY_ACC=CAM_ASM_001111 /LENGTH=624 /DNA_ID=CAMNT_0044488231 /DNA_START=128 /DNA_END=2002 /DNA_ORIENTATION=+